MRLAPAFVLVLIGCSSSGTDATVDAAPEAAPSVCATDPRVQPFALGVTAKAPSGATLTIKSAMPNPPAKGDNEWTLTLTDASSQPIDGATFAVKPWMPDHKHGSSIVPAIAGSGGGSYTLTRLNLFMPGIWQITFSITHGATTEDAVFTLCIPT